MFEPVWFGNYIIPRWEALLLLGGGLILAVCLALAILGAIIWAVSTTVNWR